MKHTLFILVCGALLSFMCLPAFATRVYTPSSSNSVTGGGKSYCQGATATVLKFKYNTCNLGTGTRSGTALIISWFQNATNSTTGGTLVNTTAVNTTRGSTGTVSYRPVTTSVGTQYYYCVITWAGAGTCNTAGSLTSAATGSVTVKDVAAPVTGPTSVCSGATITLSDAVAGGTWRSLSTARATVVATTGVVTGVAKGNATIRYTTGCGTAMTSIVTVNATPAAITGTTSICAGSTTTLADATTGGTWNSSNMARATVDATTGIVTGVTSGTCLISYITGCGTAATTTFTVNTQPAAITGASTVCVGGTTSLADATAGGAWTSSSAAKATVSGTGTVTGVAAGTVTITYSVGTCRSVTVMTVSAAPAAIGGSSSVCTGAFITLTNTAAGGIWSSSNTAAATVSATGDVYAVAAGITTITYTTGCGSNATKLVTVSGTISPTTGTLNICAGSTTTLSNATGGGTWSSANAAVATAGTGTGIITGVAAGTALITYRVATCFAFSTVTVMALPAAISGTSSVCIGAGTTLTNPVAGGVWSSSNSTIASIDAAAGMVTGYTAGVCNISYATACGTPAVYSFTVNATPAAIAGSTGVCVGATSILTNTAGGGAWSSLNGAVASITSSGTVTGVAADTTTIVYGIGSCTVNTLVTVNPLADAGTITGSTTLCQENMIALANAADDGSGDWNTSDTTIAVADNFGNVLGVSGGSVTISFSMTNGCGTAYTTFGMTITALPDVDTVVSDTAVCVGATTPMTNTVSGGVWTSDNNAVATVSGTGVVTGVTTGTANISYSLTNSCGTDYDAVMIAVTTIPAAGTISGTQTVCAGATRTFTDPATGGAWSSSNTSVATIDATGLITGVAAGTALISYSVTNACGAGIATRALTVNPLPAAGTITGSSTVCSGSTITLSDVAAGGVWTSSSTAKATVTAGGVVTGVAAGTAAISYTVTNGCGSASATAVITITTPPAAITGGSAVCAGATMALADVTAGGAWSSSNTAKATVDAAGTVTGVASGSCTITYSTGCVSVAAKAVTINASPAGITGTTTVCAGAATVTLNDATGGGVWSSSNTAVCTVAAGVVTNVAAGTSTISYTVAGCSAMAIFNVNPLPSASLSVVSGSICSSANINTTASVTGGFSISGYSWSPASGLSATTTAAVTASPAAPTAYTVTVTANDGCSRTASMTVGTPVFTVTAASTYPCTGVADVITTSGTAGTTYTWIPASFLSATTGSSVSVTATAAGAITYTVTGTIAANGCTASNTKMLGVNAYSGSLPWNEGFETYANNTLPCNESMTTNGSYGHAATGTVASVQAWASTDPPLGYTSTSTTIAANTLVNPASTQLAGFGFFADNDYFWTPGFSVTAGNTYKFSYYYRTDGNGTMGDYNAYMYANTTQSSAGATAFQSFSVAVTPGSNAALSVSNMINFNNITYRQYTGYFTPATTGIYYMGINARDNNLLLTYYWGFDDVSFDVAPTCTAPATASSVACTPATGTNTILSVTAASADSFLTIAMLAAAGTPSAAPVNGSCYALGSTLGGGTIVAKGTPGSSMWAAASFLTGGTSFHLYTYTYKHDSCNIVAYSAASPSVATFTVCDSAAPAPPTIAMVMPTGTLGSVNVALSGLPAHASGSVTLYAWTNALGTVPASPASYAVPALSSTYTVTGVSTSTNLWFTVTETLAGCPTNSLVSAQVIYPMSLPWNQDFETASSLNQLSPNGMQANAAYYTDQAGSIWGEEDNRTNYITAHGASWDYLFFGGATTSSSFPGTGNPYIPIALYANQWLVTPGLYCPSAGTYNLSFWYNNTAPAFTTVKIQYSNSAALPDNLSSNMTGATTIASFTPTTGGWRQYTVPVSVGAGPQILYFGIDVIAGSSSAYMAIDDIEVCQTPTVTVTNSSSTASVCRSGSVALGASSVPSAALTTGTWGYTWAGPGTVTSTGTSATGANLASVGTNPVYSVTVVNSADLWNVCSVRATTTATITPSPSLTGAANSGPVCAGSTLNLTTSGALNVTGYAWSGPVAITSSSSSAASVPAATTAATGAYSVTVNNGAGSGCTAVYTTTATVNPLPSGGTITGTTTVCTGATTTLSDATGGGVWSSTTTAVATVTAGGVVRGVTTGTTTISYTVTNTCGTASATTVVTVNAAPSAGSVTGTATVCAGATTTLSDATGGGVWSSSNAAKATVTGAGVVTGVSAGTASISYTVTNGCGSTSATAAVTVNPLPLAGTITGTTSACTGSTTTLSDATGGGAWSSSAALVATVTAGGVVNGVTVGTATISYTVTNGCGTANATAVVTVNPLPFAGSVTGTATVCAGATTTLSDATGGGVWSSSNTAKATITGAGVVTGVASGTSTISYLVTTGCGTANATAVVTVNPLPSAGSITGTATVCAGATTTLSDATGGGVWSSSNTAKATITGAGVVTGVASGTSTISYAVTSGCGTAYATSVVTVNPLPSAGSITGTATVCAGATTTLSDATGGGVWSSSNTAKATITGAGVVTGVASGTSTISYVVTTGCGTANATAVVTVNPLPSAGSITGTATVCADATTTLSDAVSGGIWSSSNTSVATIISGGLVTGVASGTAVISYTVSNSCGTAIASAAVTVNPLPAAGTITGTATVCAGSTTTLSDAVSGGAWTSADATIASVTSGGVATGVANGSVSISYTVTNGCGSATTSAAVTVNPLPAAGTITGTATVCAGSTITLSDAVIGGAWTSADATIASVTSGGVATGVANGSVSISYTVTNGCGSATTSAAVTVNPLPAAGTITGTATVCAGSTITLSDAVIGGAWTSADATIASVTSGGVVTGVANGSVNISYTVTNGCGSATTSAAVTVNPLPTAGTITGTATVCAGSTTTLSDAVSGGAWTSADATIASVTSGGVVTGVANGSVNISYTVSNGCGSATTSAAVTVNPLPAAGTITGTATVCAGSTTTLSDAVSGGAWTSADATIASVTSGGIVTGVANGSVNISYTVTNGCGSATTSAAVTVNPLPAAGTITGTATVCAGSTTTLSDAVSGGAWTSADATIASVTSGGVVTGVANGSVNISYTVSNGCGSATTSAAVTVNPLPAAGTITGTATVCAGSTTTLSDAVSGGAWSSADATIASVTSGGVVTGVANGSVNISYTVSNGCGSATTSAAVTVNPLPAAGTITGTATVCAGSTTTLSDAVSGGAWTSADATIASVTSGGVVTGVANGSVNISYTVTNGCGSATTSAAVTVNPLPAAGTITGTATVCAGSTTTLSDAVSGGAWTSADATIASVTSGGIVTGVANGSVSISYTVTNGCGSATTSAAVTVNPLPAAGTITGTASVCAGSTTTLSDAVSGGAWTSADATIASVTSGGIVTGVANGSVNISYTVTNGCGSATTSAAVTVNPLPTAGTITGTAAVCAGSTTTLSDAVSGGAWTSADATIASVTSGGIVTGVANGSVNISYTVSNGCGSAITSAAVTVNPLPAAGTITGTATVCAGSTTTLSDAVSGGAWTSADATIASVTSGGVVTGVANGSVNISYTVTNGCGSATTSAAVTVNPLPAAGTITGTATVCAGSTTTLSDAVSGGAWTSADATIASVTSGGIVTGVANGSVNISYTVTNGCGSATTSAAVTVNPLPTAGTITGTATVCAGSTTTLSDAVSGGAWTSADATIASVTSGGIVTGVANGSVNISYTVTNGCGSASTSAAVTVNPLPTAGTITGTATVCAGSTTTLSDAVSGGAWTSADATIASVTSGGVVTGVANGSVNISYTVTNGCGSATTSAAVTVNPLPTAGTITGTATVTNGATTTLADAVSGGVWTSSNTSIATVSAGGVVSGVVPGTALISYAVTNSCGTAYTAATVTVNGAAITGVATVCTGFTTTLHDAVSGGTWSSSTGSIAIVGSATGIVTGVSGGSATITYTFGGGSTATAVVTVISSVPSISGPATLCGGSAATLTNAIGGGSWLSSNASVVGIGSASGIVTGIATGSAAITYTLGSGCATTTTVTVSTALSSITGTASACIGLSSALTNATSGGTWSSGSIGTAIVDVSSGIVTGIAAGVATITYTAGAGCTATRSYTVNALPGAITGTTTGCAGTTTTLHSATTGGVWSSNHTSVASVNSGTGVVTHIAPGTADITYTIGTGCTTSTPETVILSPLPITGPTSVCLGFEVGLNDAGGGTWSSSNTAVAIVGSSSGIVTGVSLGSSLITYSLPCGIATQVVMVVPPVSGPPTVASVSPIVGAPSSLVTIIGTNFNTTPVNNIVYFGATQATVAASTGTGLSVIVPVSATYMPVSITNVDCALTGYSQFSFLPDYDNSAYIAGAVNFDPRVNFTTGTNPTFIAVGDLDGDGQPDLVVTNVSDNTVSVYHNSSVTGTIDAGTLDAKVDFATGIYPISISIGDIDGDGKLDLAVANQISNSVSVLRNTASTGSITASSFAPKVDFATGINPMSIAIGDFDQDGKIDLAVPNFYSNTVSVFRNTAPFGSITSSSFAARVDFVTGTHPYSIAIGDMDGDGRQDMVIANQAAASVSVLRNTATSGTINSSSFAAKVDFACGVQPLSIAVGDLDGDGKTDIAVANSISRTISVLRNTATSGSITSGSFAANVDFTAGILPYNIAIGDINGDGKADIAVANLGSDRTPGSTTVSVFRNTSTSGSITGGSFAPKVDFIMGSSPKGVAIVDIDGDGKPELTVTNVNDNTLSIIRNNPLTPITGAPIVCGTGSTTALSNSVAGGAWSSSNTAVASIDNATGIVTGLALGTTTISYTLPGGTLTRIVSVNSGIASISGASTVCIGATATLTNATSGGVWHSSNTAIANVGSATGVVTGITSGSATITYAMSSGCTATMAITVNPPAITGFTSLCTGLTTALSDAGTGGTWTSANTAIASVDAATGIVTGISTGAAAITYTSGAGCAATTTVNVMSSPAVITGTLGACLGGTTALSNATTGGTWSSVSTSIATVGYTGIVSGIATGVAYVTYSIGSGCSSIAAVTVNPLPAATTGSGSVCPGTTTTLANTGGGTWSSSNAGIVSIGSATGVATGVITGTASIYYTLPTGCSTATVVTVNSIPSAITGSSAVCQGGTTVLTGSGGGTWSKSGTALAIGSASGIVAGITTGSGSVTYTVGTGCYVTRALTVNPLPSSISGPSAVCAGSSIVLTNSGGGTWSCSPTSIASMVGGTGVISGIAAGTVTVSYTLGTGCSSTTVVTVNPVPSAITGSVNFCVGTSAALADATSGGVWSSSNPAVATANAATGVVSGISAGTSLVSYALGTGCMATTTVVANALPAPITGSTAFCAGLERMLTDATAGGTWSSSNSAIATVDATTGGVIGIAGGTAVITYTLPCGIATSVVTIYLPPPGPPAITSVSPYVGMPSSSVTIAGANFNALPTDNIVYFGAVKATVVTASPTLLTVTVPTGATYMPVTVDLVGCALTGYSQKSFLPVYDNSSYVSGVVNFDPHQHCAAGSNPYSVAIGDLDGDGKPDLAVANLSDNTFSVYRNLSTSGTITSASFAARVNYATGVQPYSVAIGDIDGDGKLDVAIANMVSNTVSLFRNTSTPGCITSASFAAKVDFATGVNPISVAIADLDRDGRADVVAANFYSNTVSVFRNTGSVGVINTATLAAKVDLVGGSHPYSVAAGDIDGDGKADLAVTNQGANTVSVFRNTSTSGTINSGSFAAKVDFATGVNPYSVAIGDIDGDGKADLAVVNNGANTVSVLRNTSSVGSVSMGSKIDFAVGTSPYNVAIGDINGDSKADLVVANATSSDVSVLRNTATAGSITGASMAAKVDFHTCGSPRAVAIGDLDGDGKPDIAVASLTSDMVCMLRNNPLAPISGATSLCGGSSTSALSDAAISGSWCSSNTSVATVGTASGIVTGVSAGTSLITYRVTGGFTTTTVTVYAVPSAITGAGTICASATTTLSSASAGGLWSSGNPAIASVSAASGVVSGVSAGTTNITYAIAPGCLVTKTVGVNPLPVAGTLSGPSTVSVGSVITLTSSGPGGTWTSSSTPTATVGLSTGLVTGVAINTANITYTVTNSCGTAYTSTSITVVAAGGRGIASGSSAGTPEGEIRIMPNPNSGQFMVRGMLASTADAEVTMELTNMLGQVVYTARTIAKEGKVNDQVSLTDIVNGMYTLTLRSAAEIKTLHVIIAH